MDVDQSMPENPAMTFDEELKSLRPQLHSAAEYCEKSYLHSEQKHMVLDNLKAYAIELYHGSENYMSKSDKKVHFSPHIQTDPRQHIQARPRLFPSGASAAKTLLWHLASETKSTLKGSPRESLLKIWKE
ncbi:unnamed protein product [Fraxinus pennsylvanica]|uniref:Uncharacterized protein n=1 Tax=Fraxinus pennsylvanica TaxID=56036 RepID=A0AAD1Z7A9_9LAMI|nr:unnamed protein product [Fraxinus pennsylvanica]